MRRGHQIAGLAFLAAAALLGWEGSRLTYYSSLGPGPGFFPVWLCILLALLSVGVLVRATLSPVEPLPADFWPEPDGIRRILAVVGSLAFAALALPFLGYRLTMLAFGFGLMVILGRRNPIEILAIALLGSFGTYALFVDRLGVALPVGKFGL